MRATAAALALALLASPALADQLTLKDGRKVTLDAPIRIGGKVVDGATRGQKVSVDEAEVVAPPLWSLAVLLKLKDGREVPVVGLHRAEGAVRFQVLGSGAKRQVPEDTIDWPPLRTLPVLLKLADGRELVVAGVNRKDGNVRFEVAQSGEKRMVPEAQVSSPALDTLPVRVKLADGRELSATGLERAGGKVRYQDVATGETVEVAEAEVVSPALTAMASAEPAPPPPPVEPSPAPTPPPVVEPTPVPPVAVASNVPEYELLPDRWTILDTLLGVLPPSPRLVRGRTSDPYNQNTLKGDRPVMGDSVFLVLTASLDAPGEVRRLPIGSGVSAEGPGRYEFFGDGNQFFTSPKALVSLELFKGQTAFRPKTWALKVTGAGNVNYVRLRERNALNIDPRAGRTRERERASLEEAFAEVKLADLSQNFDTVSLRAGIQGFVSDFRGLIFSDFNLGARLFGNAANNRWQYNAAVFDLLEKETNSELNTFELREHKVGVANLFRQDFLAKGHTLLLSYHRSQDEAAEEPHYDSNDFPVRPARIGTPVLHEIKTNYLGLATDGHLGRWNVSSAFYHVFGTDEAQPLGGRLDAEQDVQAFLGALELSLDKDWARFKLTGFFASGDDDAEDGKARGFDSIYDNSNFAGGPFSFWSRSGIPLTQTAVLLKSPGSLLPDLRSNKFEGQANHVNPGVLLAGLALDLEVTPKLKAVLNANYLRFHKTGALELLLFQPGIHQSIGVDLGAGVLWRPKLNENLVVTAGVTGLLPGAGFDDLFSSPCGSAVAVAGCGADSRTLYNAFVQFKLTY